jgi:hypothetical protein
MILTLGDSFTQGEELTDRQQAWPYLLGQLLSEPVQNLGESGSCNDSMVRKLLEQTADRRYSLVVVGWTDPVRFEAWSEIINAPTTIMPASLAKLPWTTDYYRYSYNDQYAWLRWIQQVVLLQEYLTARDQPYLFISVAGSQHYCEYSTNIIKLCELVRKDRFVGWPDRGMIEITKGCELGPGGHPLVQGHERIVNEIAKYIRA